MHTYRYLSCTALQTLSKGHMFLYRLTMSGYITSPCLKHREPQNLLPANQESTTEEKETSTHAVPSPPPQVSSYSDGESPAHNLPSGQVSIARYILTTKTPE